MINEIADQESRTGKFRCIECGNIALMDINSASRICEKCIGIKFEKSQFLPVPNPIKATTSHRPARSLSSDHHYKKNSGRMRYRLLMADGRDFHISAQMYADYTAIGLFKPHKSKNNITIVVLSTCKQVNKYDQLRSVPSDHLQAKVFRNGDLIVRAKEMEILPPDVAWELRSRLGDLIRDRGKTEAA